MGPTRLVIVLTLVLAGCGSDDTSTSANADLAVAGGADMGCATTCASCSSGLTCVTIPGGYAAAACMTPCNTDDDCGRTATCTTIDHASPAGSYCVSTGAPYLCPGSEGCSPTIFTSSCDGDVLLRSSGGLVCGTERKHCPNGCGIVTTDGGSGPGCL